MVEGLTLSRLTPTICIRRNAALHTAAQQPLQLGTCPEDLLSSHLDNNGYDVQDRGEIGKAPKSPLRLAKGGLIVPRHRSIVIPRIAF
jgi:hypothetical protein